MVNAKDIDNFEAYHVLDFSSAIFDERGTGTIVHTNSAYFAMVTSSGTCHSLHKHLPTEQFIHTAYTTSK